MSPSLSNSSPAQRVLLFGPQALAVDSKFFQKFSTQIWPDVVKSTPKLENVQGEKLLKELDSALRTGNISESLFPLPNVILSPLTVIIHLMQYSAHVKAWLPDLSDSEEIPVSTASSTETLGLCTGMLSAFAVGCASTLAELQQYGAVAVRLGMLIGALVDAEEHSSPSDGPAVSFSISWTGAESGTSVHAVLEQFPEAYISIFADEKRSTVTAPKGRASALIQQLKEAGVHVVDLSLSGRFHWSGHQADAEHLIQVCNQDRRFQFPDASKLVFSSSLATQGHATPAGSLHEITLREILLKPANWIETFGVLNSSQLTSSDFKIICFGTERCVPPTVARKLGSRVIQVSDIDLSSPEISRTLLGPGMSTPPSFAHLPDDRIAVIGMAGHLPGAKDLDDFWHVLASGKSQHVEVPTDRFRMETPWRGAEADRKWYGNFIQDHDTFDHKFFKKSPREMASTDPQHRVILQCAYQAVEQSGYFRSRDIDAHIGCYMGVGNDEYDRNIACHPATAYSATGNLRSFIAGKVSHYFGWTGPSLTIDTACSSSAVAIHYACRAILHGECSTALAGGVNVITHPEWFQNLAGASFLSPTGQCKPFDAKGDGYCRGEAAGAVYLKKYSAAVADGDQIFGVIASTRVYQNQNCTAITVPNALSLSDLFVDALKQARLEPQTVSVVEAHGTGTPVGDPAEYDAIRKVMGGSIRSDTLYLSSVKGNVGHTEFASGVVSLLKILLMLNKGSIPPQASHTTISPSLKAVPEDRIEIATRSKPWSAGFRAALINNYGASGSNASMVITQNPKASSLVVSHAEEGQPFWFCGLDENSVRSYITRFRRFIQSSSATDVSLANLSFQVSRQSNRSLPHALVFSARSSGELEQKLAAFERGDKSVMAAQTPGPRPVILCFGGQISTFIGLDKDIYDRVAVLRANLNHCDSVARSLGLESIFPDIFQRSPIQDIVKLQVALFAMQYSCAKTWVDCGLEVAAVVGHSFGELSALCLSGVLDVENAIKLVSGRALLVKNSWGSDSGSMLAVEAEFSAVNALVAKTKSASGGKPGLSIACYNGPTTFTLAGPTEAVDFAADLAKSDPIFSGIKVKKLDVTNAYHSILVEPLMSGINELGQGITFNQPTIRLETATEFRTTEKPDAGFPAKHMRNPVFFNHAVQRLAKDFPAAIWLEAGSKSTVTNLASRALGNPSAAHFQPMNITSEGSWSFLVDATTKLWKEGLDVSFWAHHAKQISEYAPVILPPYQFERSRHWLDLTPPPMPDVPVVEHPPQVEVPKTLTTFMGYQDKQNRIARFRVNTAIDKFQKPLQANFVVQTAVLTPGILQLQIALDAVKSLRPDVSESSIQPELHGMTFHNAFPVDPSKAVYLDAESKDDERLTWEWKLSTADTVYTTGKIVFHPADSTQLHESFQSLVRLSGRKRCVNLLESNDVDEVLQGRNIYRAFEPVVEYKEPFRHVTKIAGTDGESAGRVTKAYDGEAWIDPALTECFCQVAGIYVNLMTSADSLSERGIFVTEKIGRWIRNPKLQSGTSHSQDWDVFAVHHLESDNQYISDVFAFDRLDGSLVEAILGISYQKVPLASFRKVLSRAAQSTGQVPAAITTTAPKQVHEPVVLPSAPVAARESANKLPAKKAPKPAGPDFNGKTREIVCNLSGLEPEEVKDDSDLVEIGIDSLMAMELVREVEAAFKVTLQNEQLNDLTDFHSLVSCIRFTVGFADDDGADTPDTEYSLEEDPEPILKTDSVVTETHEARNSASPVDHDGVLPPSTVLDVFREVKWTTDDFIVKGQLGTYYDKVMPRSTELTIVYILNAFEQLGCNIRAASPGQQLERVPYLPKHERFMNYIIYPLLEKEARLIDIKGSVITRTAVAPPVKPADVLLDELLRDEPVHKAEHQLTGLIGPKFADCLSGKQDGLQLIFGNPEGREIVTDMYANSPVTGIWIQQLSYFLEQLVARLPKDGQPLCILEMGAGTGGTTSKIVPLLARLGVPVEYTMTDLSGSLVAAARKRFKHYPFMKFKPLDIEAQPDEKLLQSQHIIMATNCVHATRDLSISLKNINRILKPNGFLILLEMTEQAPWCDFIFGLLEGWWLFEDDREYVLAPAEYWERTLHSVGFGHVDWTEGQMPESSLQRLIIAHASGPRYPRGVRPPSPPEPAPTLPDVTDRQTVIDAYIEKYTNGFRAPVDSSTIPARPPPSGKVVLVTGATGSLGGHIVANVARLPDVHTVVCLNRLSQSPAEDRQRKSLAMRGIQLDEESLAKLNVIETDTSKPMLGLSQEIYSHLVDTVTHIVHSAWPMSLTRPVRLYELQFKVFRNIIDFAREITDHRPAPFKLGFQFISSLAVVANYPLWKGKPLVPEGPTSVETVPQAGYADAKLVCEHILGKTLHQYPDRFHPTVVRIAQISGSTSNGYWNPTEYMPFLIKSSQVLKLLPKLDGTLSWYPVDLVAATLGELLMSETTSELVYHIDNPSRQPWAEMISSLAQALDLGPDEIVPYQQWLDRVRRFRGSINDNPALQLEEFFIHYFIPMSCGGLVLDTAKTKVHSKTMREIGPVSSDLVAKYIASWKESGFLHQ
ncbi:Conidial yellow pigment biosynthesis polyketide synthase [Cytospora mali]|uniref:Conidial yellow pigment biosynthesis polyketide synthase n=1 Tax=Cytospora mali TaxID=578113 RepID=A0A194VUB8_CYTMA|nr:Conidial yellow pigment biosynthesis polyketide synthase [Valsa mali]